MHPTQWKSLLLRRRGVSGGFSKSLAVPWAPVDHIPPLGVDTHRATARIGPPATCHEDAANAHGIKRIGAESNTQGRLDVGILTGDVSLEPIPSRSANPRS